ncbi:hypothetical protein CDL12_24938 [Handroanthus impetiginosus]|uniref:AT-hook motif nuclear-localized protein n=1 Tax=Handroanthus impetiginosus TaxID=429701 RepID=A0A2G9GB59_9LAMI|nr:hypothetical protein CDL12_24938 [Handroanthus impetiginosus]
MEGEKSNINNVIVPQVLASVAGAVESPAFPSSEGEAADIGLEEKKNYVDGGDEQQALVVVSGSGGQEEFIAKRRRGRPRKQLMRIPESLTPPEQRGRGRPKGSGKWQIWDSLADASGSQFTPHMITVHRGEDIVQKICSFSQRPSEALCIISAVGVLSTAELYRPGSYTSIVKHEGRFDIVSLNGSHEINRRGAINRKVFLLAIQLAKPDGTVFGGAVGGSLVVREPAQVVFATFKLKVRASSKVRHSVELPGPNNGAVAVAVLPTQTTNGNGSGSMDNGTLLTLPSVSAPAPPVGIAAVNDADHHVNCVSSEAFDWNSLGSSSQHMPMMSDVITGAVTN